MIRLPFYGGPADGGAINVSNDIDILDRRYGDLRIGVVIRESQCYVYYYVCQSKRLNFEEVHKLTGPANELPSNSSTFRLHYIDL